MVGTSFSKPPGGRRSSLTSLRHGKALGGLFTWEHVLGIQRAPFLTAKSTELREHFPAVALRSHQHGDQPSWFAQDRKDPRPVNTSVLGAGGQAD